MARQPACLKMDMAPHRIEQVWNQQHLSEPVLAPDMRLWQYTAPAVVLGRSQRGLVDVEMARRRADIDVVERQAGGGAVLIGPWMLSASVVLPTSHRLVTASTAESYQWLGDLYASVLARIGVATHVLTPDEAHHLQQGKEGSAVGWACFGGLSPGELVVGTRKIVGFAQVRKRNGILLVAGLLMNNPDWPLLCRVMEKQNLDADQLSRCTTSCEEQLGHAVAPVTIADLLGPALKAALGGDK